VTVIYSSQVTVLFDLCQVVFASVVKAFRRRMCGCMVKLTEKKKCEEDTPIAKSPVLACGELRV
jgi:hypothetical protein